MSWQFLSHVKTKFSKNGAIENANDVTWWNNVFNGAHFNFHPESDLREEIINKRVLGKEMCGSEREEISFSDRQCDSWTWTGSEMFITLRCSCWWILIRRGFHWKQPWIALWWICARGFSLRRRLFQHNWSRLHFRLARCFSLWSYFEDVVSAKRNPSKRK